LILDVYSANNERFSLYARGCLDLKSKLYGVFDLFAIVRVTYRCNDFSDLNFVRSATVCGDNYSLAKNWRGQKLLSSALRLTSRVLRYDVNDVDLRKNNGYFGDISLLLRQISSGKNDCGAVLSYLDSIIAKSGCGFVLPDDIYLFPGRNRIVYYDYSLNAFTSQKLTASFSFGLTINQVKFLRKLRSSCVLPISDSDYAVLFRFYQNYFAYHM